MRSKLQKLHGKVGTIVDDIIREHKEIKEFESTEADDFVDVLLNLQDPCKLGVPLTMQNIKAMTLVSTLIWGKV